MKLTIDPLPFRHLPIPEMVRTVADLGYEYIEFSQRDDWWPFYLHPRANDEMVQTLKKSLKETGVKIASMLPITRWASPTRTCAWPRCASGCARSTSPSSWASTR